MNFTELELPGLIEITPKRFVDERGYFAETFREDVFRDRIGNIHFVQDNQSLSTEQGTLRGLHFQTAPFAQGKLARCLAGSLFDVAVDLRVGSPFFGRWAAITLSADLGNELWIPPGFAHGFCTLEPNTVISYKVTAYYSAAHDKGVSSHDPDLAIRWPSTASLNTLSAKDRLQPALADLPAYFSFEA
jgi:dTDP-4-dehydrorhamnose 3,5-epimerase